MKDTNRMPAHDDRALTQFPPAICFGVYDRDGRLVSVLLRGLDAGQVPGYMDRAYPETAPHSWKTVLVTVNEIATSAPFATLPDQPPMTCPLCGRGTAANGMCFNCHPMPVPCPVCHKGRRVNGVCDECF